MTGLAKYSPAVSKGLLPTGFLKRKGAGKGGGGSECQADGTTSKYYSAAQRSVTLIASSVFLTDRLFVKECNQFLNSFKTHLQQNLGPARGKYIFKSDQTLESGSLH